jgi:hypothetical protein
MPPNNDRRSSPENIFSGKFMGPVHAGRGDININRYVKSALLGEGSPRITELNVDDQGNLVIKSAEDTEATRLPQSEAFERIASAADEVRKQLWELYKEDRTQLKRWSTASLIASALGFAIVLFGILTVLAGDTTVGALTAVVGVIPEIAASLFYHHTKELNSRLDINRQELNEAEGIHKAIELVLTMDTEAQAQLKEALILRILDGNVRNQPDMSNSQSSTFEY